MKKLILIALACSFTTVLQASDKDGETRTASVKVSVSSSDLINIQAKYTELTVESWDKNEVEIEATVRFDGKITDKVQKFLDEFDQHVKDNIIKSSTELKIDTRLDEPNKIQIGSRNVGIILSYGDDELKISYKIKAPGNNKYVIANSYEDMRLIGTFDQVELSQYSGELEAGTIRKANMNLKYGSATIQSIGTAKMEIYEQKLNVGTIDELTINTKYSDLDLKSCGNLEFVSYESDIQIGTAEQLSGDLKYGEIEITNELSEAEMTLYEVDIEAKEIGKIRLENSKYCSFDIDKVGNILFDQSYEDETELGLVHTFKSLNSKYGNHKIGRLAGSLDLAAYEDEIEIEEIGASATSINIDGKYIDSIIDTDDRSFVLLTDIKYGKVEYDESGVDIKRYIKADDRLEVEAHSKIKTTTPVKITVKGYEVDVRLN
ncbi:MAG: hypothetical protein RLN88_06325 [Ekhidna sp.]|uniref:hypothetical protein n=1 Tax=Ekhidna sp. TaxID=2608089 RepID=UPI0032EB8630